MDLIIHVTKESAKVKVLIEGEIDAYTVPRLTETLLPLMKEKGNVVEVNLSMVRYMDSTGLGAFIRALKSGKENGSSLILINLQERVYRLFRITGLNEIIEIHKAIEVNK